jgi:rhodanese-related sulfurtransferase
MVPLANADKLPTGVQLVDVRPTAQYTTGHLKGAISIPFDPDNHIIDTAKFPADKAILLYCNHGAISAEAFDALPETTARRVKVLEADLVCEAGHCRVLAR